MMNERKQGLSWVYADALHFILHPYICLLG